MHQLLILHAKMLCDLGQTSVLALSKIEKNPALSANSFKFVMPKGADVFNN